MIFRRIIVTIVLISSILFIWFWLDYNDYFNSDYRELSAQEISLFEWKDYYSASGEEHQRVYIEQFGNDKYAYSGRKVKRVKLFKNVPIFNIFTARTLSGEQSDYFLEFCNDPDNFGWSETTWSDAESGYFFKLYDVREKVVGKNIFLSGGLWAVLRDTVFSKDEIRLAQREGNVGH